MTERNPICISSGHGLKIRGASGSPVPPEMDEVDEVRKIVDRVYDILQAAGVTVYKFHDDVSTNVSDNLSRIVSFHNSKAIGPTAVNLSVHLNATEGAYGTEVLYITQEALAAEMSKGIAAAGGFKNRGAKYRNDLTFLSSTIAPAVLAECWFCDSTSDCNLARQPQRWEAICQAIATSIAGKALGPGPSPPEPGPEPPPDEKTRPVIGLGDYGNNVAEVQVRLGTSVDGSFGQGTEDAVISFQRTSGLQADGVVGVQTWAALDKLSPLAAYPPPLPPKFDQATINKLGNLAAASPIASYAWKDRGRAPAGYIRGMAVAFAQAVLRYNAGDPIIRDMAAANTHNDEIDALSWYNSNFAALGMSNDLGSIDTLRHLYVLLLGLGMRESSGKHCEGRDTSSSNTSSDTAEAGLFQSSWNASSASTDFLNAADQYDPDSVQGYMAVFAEGVTCNSSSWASYGSGAGFAFQETCKWSPTYAVDTCAITLRRLRQHYGPINRKEAEIRGDADKMFKQVQDFVATLPPWSMDIPEVPETKPPETLNEVEALLDAKPDELHRDAHVQWLVESMDYILRKEL